jgi:hypothetical protein
MSIKNQKPTHLKCDCGHQNDDELLTEQLVADMAKVSFSTIKYWEQIGKIPYVKVGMHRMIWRSSFDLVFKKPVKIKDVGDGHEGVSNVAS